MELKSWLFGAAGAAALIAGPAIAARQPSLQRPARMPTDTTIVVTAKRLNAARASIQPQVGASTYTINAQAIQALPGGDNTPLNQVVLQTPGAVQDSFGQLHIRGEHNGLQFRLNGVILPEGLSVFSQALSPRLAGSVELITGALPAEYGLRTAGIIDISTKTGMNDGGEVSVYGGSHDEIEPSFGYGGHAGNTNFFVSGSYLQNDLGIESPDGRSDPIHDRTQQYQGFAYLEHIIDPEDQLSVILGASDQRFQIPDVAGELNGGLGLDVGGRTNFPSQDLNESQHETTQYGVVSYLHSTDRFTGQVSLFGRYSTLAFTPDPVGDILYDGVSQAADKTDTAAGLQAEAAYHLGDEHTVRGGVIVEVDRSTSQTRSQVLLLDNNPADANFGGQISDQPFTIVDDGAKTAATYSAYLQDEWKLAQGLTLNYGLRFDQFDGFRDENQLSPRINLVWLPTPSTTIHAGYARYFSPPPFELIADESVAEVRRPDGQSADHLDGCAGGDRPTPRPIPERRANYFDVGAEQRRSRRDLTVGAGRQLLQAVDAPDRRGPVRRADHPDAIQLCGRPPVGRRADAAYNKGTAVGLRQLRLHSVAQGRDLISSQFSFDQASLDYIATHSIFLDHDESYAASAGLSYLWRGTRFGGDLIYGSGLRADLPLKTPITFADGSVLTAIPNGEELPAYAQVNLSLSHRFERVATGPCEVCFDVINLF